MKKIIYYQNSPKKAKELAISVFLGFHDYYRNDTKKTKNDGCLDLLVKKIIHITKYPDRYKDKEEMIPLEETDWYGELPKTTTMTSKYNGKKVKFI